MVVFSVGCSACGKTRYGNILKSQNKDLVIVCPDDVRQEMGDISNQANNGAVFAKVNKQLEDALKDNKNVYYSATNLTKKSRKTLMELCKKYNQEVIAVLFMDSMDYKLCESRCKKDLDNKVARSNTLVKVNDTDTVIKSQSDKFKELMKNLPSFREELKNNSRTYRIVEM